MKIWIGLTFNSSPSLQKRKPPYHPTPSQGKTIKQADGDYVFSCEKQSSRFFQASFFIATFVNPVTI